MVISRLEHLEQAAKSCMVKIGPSASEFFPIVPWSAQKERTRRKVGRVVLFPCLRTTPRLGERGKNVGPEIAFEIHRTLLAEYLGLLEKVRAAQLEGEEILKPGMGSVAIRPLLQELKVQYNAARAEYLEHLLEHHC